MSAAGLLLERCRAEGVTLVPNRDTLKVRAARPPPPELFEALREHKFELLAELDAGLPSRVRQRVREECDRLGIDAAPVLRQFDLWRYTRSDLLEMSEWPDKTMERHVQLLHWESAESFAAKNQ